MAKKRTKRALKRKALATKKSKPRKTAAKKKELHRAKKPKE